MKNVFAQSLLVIVVFVVFIAPVWADTTFHQSPVVSKFTQELRGVGPGGIPVATPDGVRNWNNGFTMDRRGHKVPNIIVADHYTIDINEFTDILHPDLGPTTFWGYNPRNALGVTGIPAQKYLGGIIIAQRGKPVQITFRNNLPNQHILPVDTTIMGAEPGTAQNRTSTHLHGGLVPWVSDGGPYAWWDPQGENGISFLNNAVLRPGEKNIPANEAEFYYPNDQSARLVWYHDHAIGITRLNAYAGIASAYIIRDNFEGSVLVGQLGLPKFIENGGRELPLVIQDKIFQDGSDTTFPGKQGFGNLWYPYFYDPARWDVAPGGNPPFPSVVAEMFGDTMLVNGVPYPRINVDPRHYRLRILNGCQARFLNLQLYENNGAGKPNFKKPGPHFLVIGTEGGFLARPVIVPSAPLKITVDASGSRTVDPANPGGSLITAPAERWDVVVDFGGKGGKRYVLCNDAPAPYPMGDALNDYPNAAGVGNTQVIMEFEVKADSAAIAKEQPFLINPSTNLAGNSQSGIDPPLAGIFPSTPVNSLSWNTTPEAPLPIPTRKGVTVRQLTLNETFDSFGRLIQMEGTNTATGILPPESDGLADFSLAYMDKATETPKAGATEVWQIVNLTGDVHPIHIHLANAQILSRRPFDMDAYFNTAVGEKANLVYTGVARGPDATELGWKETFKTFPGEVTTFIVQWTLPKSPFFVPFSPRTGGYEYVWHCHILEHEEHDMMRPLVVMP